MDEFKLRMNGLPLGIVSGIVVTVLLFIALPLLSKFDPYFNKKAERKGTLITTRRPEAPPELERDEPKQQDMEQKEMTREKQQRQRTQPKFNVPKVTLGMGGASMGGIQIGMVQDFNISDSLFMSAFNLNEVDQPPRQLRVFPPQYPYLAKRDNIEGRVVLRFVVDVDGLAKEAEVASAEPEGFFEEAALKAIERYKFKPAVKGGKDVRCIVKLPISFTLN